MRPMWRTSQRRCSRIRASYSSRPSPTRAPRPLALRMERACANALSLARHLAAHPNVARVYYPGLETHPQHELAGSLFKRPGALFSFELADGIDCFEFLNRLKVAILSSNLGDN